MDAYAAVLLESMSKFASGKFLPRMFRFVPATLASPNFGETESSIGAGKYSNVAAGVVYKFDQEKRPGVKVEKKRRGRKS